MTRRIILDRAIADDLWQLIPAGDAVPAGGKIIVPLAAWLAGHAALSARGGQVGVWLKPDDEPGLLARDVARLPLIAVQFPQFTDGRGYSIARLLRERFGYRGELRAFGDVLRDQIFYMASVGFNAFALKDGKSLEEALSAFEDFFEAYQTSVARPVPYYRRRLGGAPA
jgi:uncharacterized protein (DUF934 family)